MSALGTVREIKRLLAEDLYREAPGSPRYPVARVSPGGWRVEWKIAPTELTGGNRKPRVHCRVVAPSGKTYAESEDASVEWLDSVLP